MIPPMKSKWFFFFVFTVCSSLSLFSQKVQIKKDVALIDGVEFVRIEDKSPVQFTIFSLETGLELIYVRQYDPTPNGGIDGFDDRYFVLSFADFDGDMEFKDSRKAELIKFLYTQKIIVEGKVPEDSFKIAFERYGRKE